MYAKKPRLHGLALAFHQGRPGQSHCEAVITARLGLAYFGRAWLGSRPQAGPEEHYPELYLNRVKYPTRLRLRNGSAHRLIGSESSRWQHYPLLSWLPSVV